MAPTKRCSVKLMKTNAGIIQFTNFLVALLTPILLDKSAYGAYFLFGGLSLMTVAVLALFMPETKGKSLESIQDAFAHPIGAASSVKRVFGRRRQVPSQADWPAPPEAISPAESVELAVRPLRVGAA